MNTSNAPKILAVVPARGGSKGVKRKNVRLLAGTPLIGHTIVAAKDSGLLSHIVVSTEDEEIANVSRSFGCEVVNRPIDLAQDNTPMIPVLRHALEVCEDKYNCVYDFVMILQPTAPLRTASLIDDSITKFIQSKKSSLVSLYQVEDAHPSRMYTIINGKLKKIMEEPANALRQSLPPVYHRNGCIYISSRSLINENLIVGEDCYPYIMEEKDSLNIDTEMDLEYAEFIFSRLNNEKL